MNRLGTFISFAIAISGLVLLTEGLVGQEQTLKDQLVGSWGLVSASLERPDGTKINLFGADAKGIIIFARGGHFVVIRSTRPAVVVRSAFLAGQLAYAYFGTFTVNEADKTLDRRYDSSLVSNDLQTEYRSVVELAGNELKLTDRDPVEGKIEFVYGRGR